MDEGLGVAKNCLATSHYPPEECEVTDRLSYSTSPTPPYTNSDKDWRNRS